MKQDQHLERIPCKGKSDEHFRRRQRLRSSQDFLCVRRRGRQVRGTHLTLQYMRRPPETGRLSECGPVDARLCTALWQGSEFGPTRIGFSVSKRVGDAATRNLVKRRLREAARRRLASLVSGWDLVVTARPTSAAAGYQELAAEMDDLFIRAGIWTL